MTDQTEGDNQAALRAYINLLREQRHMSIHELAIKAGMSDNTLYNVLSWRKRAGYRLLGKVARALGVPPEELYAKAGIEVSETSSKVRRVREIIAIADTLSESDRETLLAWARMLGGNREDKASSTVDYRKDHTRRRAVAT